MIHQKRGNTITTRYIMGEPERPTPPIRYKIRQLFTATVTEPQKKPNSIGTRTKSQESG